MTGRHRTRRKKDQPTDWSRLLAWVFIPLVTLATIVAIFLGVNNQNVLGEMRRQFAEHGRDVEALVADVEALITTGREGVKTHNVRMRREHAAILTCLKDLEKCDPEQLSKILNGEIPVPPLTPDKNGGSPGKSPAPSKSPSPPGVVPTNSPGTPNPPGPTPPGPNPPGLCIDVIGCLPNLPEPLQPPGLTP